MADATPQAPLSPETEIPSTCFSCGKTASELQKALSKCSKCTTRYCSVECQKNDWDNNNHKARCAPRKSKKPASKPAATSRPSFASVNALLVIGNNDYPYLHAIPERDVYGQLIDSFRLRADDEAFYAGDAGGIYAEQDPRPGFKEYLDLAEFRDRLLPSWWNGEKRVLCQTMAVRDRWYNIFKIVEKSDIKEHYEDPLMAMKLRALAEKIYGKGLFGW